MKLYLLLLFIPLTMLAGPKNQNENKKLNLKLISDKIEIDGVIDPIWNSADSVVNFFQLSPYYNEPPSYKTIAKVLTSKSSLYCLMICYQDEKTIQQNNGMLDDFTGDIVSIMLDTFNDEKTAYKFAVNASGAKADCRLLDDARNRDYSWDGIWFADTKVYSWGYVVEMQIPYKSIQYDESASSWGLDFDRWIPDLNEDLYWNEYEKSEGQRVSKFGKLVFNDFQPSVTGLNLEIYPVGISRAIYLQNNKYNFDADAGIDILYNPSPKLKFQFTANPDFAQIEADPYDFNISRYESYFDERRPFFTEGNEVFMPSGRQRNTGFYRPLELFYSRRIGKALPGGKIVPLLFGAKAFGRINEWEYGGFLAMTGEKNYVDDGKNLTEHKAYFGSARIKKQIFGNSQIGLLFVGKQSQSNTYGVLDIDGALRESDWQLAYQFARSIKNNEGDFAVSTGFTQFTDSWVNLIRNRYIGSKFDVDQVGFVPWRGTNEFVGLTGPIWLPDKGYISQILIYAGPIFYYEKADGYTDHLGLVGYNMQFRDNWGFEINLSYGKSKDNDIIYNSYEATLSSWYNIDPKWSANLYGGYSRTYNFARDYLAFYSWTGIYFNWKALDELSLGTSYDMYVEGNPSGNIEDITFNARPFFSVTPINNLNIRVYVDNVFVRSSDKMERVIAGLLFSYNFLPKSWIYLAVNEVQDRSDSYDGSGNLLPQKLHVVDRAAVLKVKYLYYF